MIATTLTPEQRQAIYEQIGKLAVLGMDDAAAVFRELLGAIDEAERRLRNHNYTNL